MENNFKINLSTLSLSQKVLASAFIVCILIGYFVALLKIYEINHFSFNNAILYYRGDDVGDDPTRIPQSFGSLLSVAHVHTFSQAFLFAILGLIFSFSLVSERKKIFMILNAFLGIAISNLSPWLIRYCAQSTILLLPLSQIMIFLSLIFMSVTSLYDLWFRKI